MLLRIHWHNMKGQKSLLILLLFCLYTQGVAQRQALFRETFGQGEASFTNISDYTDWDNASPITYSGNGRVNGASTFNSNYEGASGGTHVILSGNQTLEISNIPIVGVTNIQLGFGVAANAEVLLTPQHPNELVVEYRFDDGEYTPLETVWTLPTQNGWNFFSSISIPNQQATTLSLRFKNMRGSNTIAAYRVDDVELTGEFVSCDNAYLYNLSVSSGELTPVFDSSVFSYTVTLPYATSVVPTVIAVPFDMRASISVHQATAFTQGNNRAEVVVTACDSIHTKTYSVDFLLQEPSSNAALDSIILDGTWIVDCDSNVFDYYVELNEVVPRMPEVLVYKQDEYAHDPEVIFPETLPGTISIQCEAQNGDVQTYNLHLYPLRSFMETFDGGETSTTQLSDGIHTFKHRWKVKGTRRNNNTVDAGKHAFSLQFMRGKASAYMELQDLLPNGIGQVSFDYMCPRDESDVAKFKLEYRSVGGTWTAAIPDGQESVEVSVSNTAQTSHIVYTLDIAQPAKIRIIRVSSSNYPRVNFDNIKITDYNTMWFDDEWTRENPTSDTLPTVVIRDSLSIDSLQGLFCKRLIVEEWATLTLNEGAEIHAETIEGKVNFQKSIIPKQWNHIAIPVENATFKPFISEQDSSAICLMTYAGITSDYGDQWSEYITGESTPLNPMVGYAAYTNRTNQSVFLEGIPNNLLTYEIPLTPRIGGGADNWYLIPNPYPFTLKGTMVAEVNRMLLQGDGAAVVYEITGDDDTTGSYNVYPSFPDIPPLSSLFVARRSDLDSVSITLSRQQSVLSVTQRAMEEPKYAVVEAKYKTGGSKIFFRYETQADTLIDRFDMEKFFSGNIHSPEVYTIVANKPLSINSFSGDKASFPLEIWIDSTVDATLCFRDFLFAFPDSMYCELHDALTQQTHDLKEQDSIVVGLEQGRNSERFRLYFHKNTVALEENFVMDSFSCKAFDHSLLVTTSQPAEIEITNTLGQVLERMSQAKGEYLHQVNISEGVYIVKIITGGQIFTRKVVF